MRLRSSQFVFLMLLVCSVQVREEYVWHLREGSVSSRVAATSQREAATEHSRKRNRLCVELERLNPAMGLSSAADMVRRTVWAMPAPVREATAVASYSGFLRT